MFVADALVLQNHLVLSNSWLSEVFNFPALLNSPSIWLYSPYNLLAINSPVGRLTFDQENWRWWAVSTRILSVRDASSLWYNFKISVYFTRNENPCKYLDNLRVFVFLFDSWLISHLDDTWLSIYTNIVCVTPFTNVFPYCHALLCLLKNFEKFSCTPIFFLLIFIFRYLANFQCILIFDT